MANSNAKSGISNHAKAGIHDDPCLSKFGHSTDCVRKPADNFRTFVRVPYSTAEQNITARSRCLNWHLPYFQLQMPTSFGSRGFILSVKQKVRSLSVACRAHSGECPNAEETRNGIPAAAWKKYVNFASKICRRMVIWNFQVSVSNNTAYHYKRH